MLQAPKGTRDVYPEDMVVREHIFSSWRRTCRRYGFELFDAPLIESLELYTQKSGDEIEKQLYNFEDKGGRAISLRPEMTPSLARMVASQGSAIKKPVRWYSIPRVFRYERMQRGRLREFFQLNLDVLGVAECTADAELMAASVGMMQDLGFTSDDFSVLFSSRTLLEEYLLFTGVKNEQLPALYALLDRKHKMDAGAFDEELTGTVGSTDMAAKVAKVLGAESLDDLGALNSDLQSFATMRELTALLEDYGLTEFVQFDIGIVRGLAYYTGVVFELFDRSRSIRAIAGGGRYDNLVSGYGGPATPAVGFAAGDVVLAELMQDLGLLESVTQEPRSEVYVVGLDDAYPSTVVTVTQQLRRAGLSAEYPLRKVALGRQLKQANAARARVVVFTGGEEGAQGSVKVKDMQRGDERVVPQADMERTVRALLSHEPGTDTA